MSGTYNATIRRVVISAWTGSPLNIMIFYYMAWQARWYLARFLSRQWLFLFLAAGKPFAHTDDNGLRSAY